MKLYKIVTPTSPSMSKLFSFNRDVDNGDVPCVDVESMEIARAIVKCETYGHFTDMSESKDFASGTTVIMASPSDKIISTTAPLFFYAVWDEEAERK